MFTYNPFADLSSHIPAIAQQYYVIAMAIAVVLGTAIDVIHKKSGKYFADKWNKSITNGQRKVGGGEKVGLAVKTAANEVLASGEFSNPQRRLSHLFTMYGFILFVVSTVVLVFNYASPGAATPPIWPMLWHIGALALCLGGYWFWFFIRVDVSSEGNPWYRIVRADLFILSLLAMATFALLWSYMQQTGTALWTEVFFGLFILASTVLFGTVIWSKFAHMFFKPAAAFQKHVEIAANGSHDNLPFLTRDDPEQRARHSMELLKDAPMDMGLGIKREKPHHY